MPKNNLKLQISIIALFPDILENHLKHLPLSRAITKGLIHINFVNLRDFAIDKRGTVDSPPYGGGPGMILRPEPIHKAITSILTDNKTKLIFLTPRGVSYNQKLAYDFSSNYNHLIIFCGRYEGIDQRVIDYFVKRSDINKNLEAEEISIGDYVLSGGEVAAMAIVESVVRLIPGAIENQKAVANESFSLTHPNSKEHPQYSRPEVWNGMEVPQILLSGHHKNIKTWKEATS